MHKISEYHPGVSVAQQAGLGRIWSHIVTRPKWTSTSGVDFYGILVCVVIIFNPFKLNGKIPLLSN